MILTTHMELTLPPTLTNLKPTLPTLPTLPILPTLPTLPTLPILSIYISSIDF